MLNPIEGAVISVTVGRTAGIVERWWPPTARGVALLAGAGIVVGGAAGTVDFPVVGTLFGAVEGAVAGAAVGAVDGLILTGLGAATRPRWVAQGTSGLVVLVAALARTAGPEPLAVSWRVEVVLTAVAVLFAGAAGPSIAVGLGRAPGVLGGRAGSTPRELVVRFLGRGTTAGAAVGAVAGVLIGVRSYLPTAPFAAVEGAVFGTVCGAVLACLALGIAILPRLLVRR